MSVEQYLKLISGLSTHTGTHVCTHRDTWVHTHTPMGVCILFSQTIILYFPMSQMSSVSSRKL